MYYNAYSSREGMNTSTIPRLSSTPGCAAPDGDFCFSRQRVRQLRSLRGMTRKTVGGKRMCLNVTWHSLRLEKKCIYRAAAKDRQRSECSLVELFAPEWKSRAKNSSFSDFSNASQIIAWKMWCSG